jgi:hypothetical protein
MSKVLSSFANLHNVTCSGRSVDLPLPPCKRIYPSRDSRDAPRQSFTNTMPRHSSELQSLTILAATCALDESCCSSSVAGAPLLGDGESRDKVDAKDRNSLVK